MLDLEPLERLRISWCGGPVDTEVTFTLSSLDGERVRLTVEQTGFSGLRAGIARVVLDLGWRDLLRRSRPRTLGRHRQEGRP